MKSYPLILTLLAACVCGCKSTEPAPRPVGPVPANSFVRSWSADSGAKNATGFYASGDQLFVYNNDNLVTGFDHQGGLKFRANVAERADRLGPPTLQGERVVFPSSSTIHIRATNGTFIRDIPLKYPIRSGLAVTNNLAFAGVDSDQGGRLAAIWLDKDYDIFRWTRLTGVVSSTPILFDNVIYAASDDGRVYALTQDPVVVWPKTEVTPDGVFHTDGKILAGIAVDETGVYVPSADSKLYCIHPATGRIRWEYYGGEPLTHTPVLGTDMVYLLQPSRGMVAFDKSVTGPRYRTPKWRNTDVAQVLSEDQQNVYVRTNDNHLAALDKATGKRLFTSERDDFVMGVSLMNAKDSTLYVLTKAGYVMAIRPVTKPGTVGAVVRVEPQAAPAELAMR